MISRVLEQEEAIRTVLSADRKTTHLVPNWQDIDVLVSINQALSPLSNLTDILSGEDYVTVSAILPLMNLLNDKFLKENKEDSQLTTDIRARIRTDLNARLSSYDTKQLLLLQTASFLDPRFKVKYLDEDEVEHVKLKLQSLLMAAPSESTASSNSECSVLNCNDSESPAPPPAKKRNLGTLFKDNEEKSDRNLETACSSISKEEELLMQLQAYISIPRLDFEENPLEWWKIHSSNYPLLAAFAKRFLSVCATSSPSERLFSSSGNIVSPTRMKLSPDKVNMLTFLSKNLD